MTKTEVLGIQNLLHFGSSFLFSFTLTVVFTCFSPLLSRVIQLLIAENSQLVGFMISNQQLLQGKMNISKLSFFDKNMTLLGSDSVTKFLDYC